MAWKRGSFHGRFNAFIETSIVPTEAFMEAMEAFTRFNKKSRQCKWLEIDSLHAACAALRGQYL